MEQPNTTYINQLSGDNVAFREKMIAILKRELPEEIQIYREQIQKNNFLAAAQSVHKLKHKVSILGLEKSYYLAETFEENLKENSIQLQKEFETILNAMDTFVKSL
ncbi:Hpt domain-containing protein [Flavobacterium sp. J27]|uniref:Hpt domain-containing protein n=1 Tax=Flavobacterium sp. J27 TaxID=2060419 RepID=UPI0010321D56|nr:Hpt domain-containing protein [Flavobacterium sp. J27]